MLKQFLFKIARSRLSAHFIGFAFEHFSALIPLKRHFENASVIVFSHPKPCFNPHLLVVPKKRIPAFSSLQLDKPEDRQFALSVFEAARTTASQKSLSCFTLMINGGRYQEVPQLHLHLIQGSTEDPLRLGIEESICPSADAVNLPASLVTAYPHPYPTRKFHYLVSAGPSLPELHLMDFSNPAQIKILIDIFVYAQKIVIGFSLPAYTLAVRVNTTNPGKGLVLHILSGDRL